jgi:hypothetical protein
MARRAALVAVVLGLVGCPTTHHQADVDGDVSDAPLDAGADDGDAAPDVRDAPADFRIELLVTHLPESEPIPGAVWRLRDVAGTETFGTIDPSGRATIECAIARAPFDLEVDAPGLGPARFLRNLVSAVSAHVHGGSPLIPPGDREVTVEVFGTAAGEEAMLSGPNVVPTRPVLGTSPIELGFRWQDPSQPADVVAWAFTPRFYMLDDLRVRLPSGSGRPRTIGVVGRGLAADSAPATLPIDLTTGPAPRRAPMHISVEAGGAWRPRGPIDYATGVPIDPDFAATPEGDFDGTVAVFDEPGASSPWFVIGTHDGWTALLPTVMDFDIPRADGAPTIVGTTLADATITVPPSRWSEVTVLLVQRNAAGEETRLAWAARPFAGSLTVVPAQADLIALGFDPAGPDVFVGAALLSLIRTEHDLDPEPLYRIESSDLHASAMLPMR